MIRVWLRKSSLYAKKRHLTSLERICNDSRFKLDDEFVFFGLENKQILSYEYVTVPLKEIKRKWENKTIALSDCHPYKYLLTGDPKIYEEYVKLNKEKHKLDIYSKERFDALIQSLDNDGFDKEKAIVIDENNVLLDGQHRCCYLLYRFGENFEVPAVRVYQYTEKKKR